MAAGAVIYSASGTLLILVNKVAIRMFPYASLLVLMQNIITVILLLVGTAWCSASLGDLPRLSRSIVVRWTPLSCMFVVMLLSSLLALKHISAVSFVVLRNLTTIVVALGERVVLGSRFSWPAVATLWGMLFGAAIYGSADLLFAATGYAWIAVNILANSIYQVHVKMLAKDDTLSPLGMSFISNAVSLPFLTACSIILHDVHDPPSLYAVLADLAPPATTSLILLSGMLGFALSTSAFLLNTMISATSIMVINNANKFAVILLSELLIERSLGPLASAGTVIVLAFAYLYSTCHKTPSTLKGTDQSPDGGPATNAENQTCDHVTARQRDAFIYVAVLCTGVLCMYAASLRV